MHSTRRAVLHFANQSALAAAVAAASADTAWAQQLENGSSGEGKLWPGYPRQDQKRVSEVVGASHFDRQRVEELVTAYPELVNANWDWGFGDWESALGAASHTGQRAIAEFLLDRGARMDIFAAAMLGHTNIVQAFVTAQPGIQRRLGPHGIPLLAHAKAGGKQASDTVAYLETLGDAGTGLKSSPLPDEHKQRYMGDFVSSRTGLKLTCRLNKAGKLVVDVRSGEYQTDNRLIVYLGDDEFYTSGVLSVRLRFAFANGKATAVTIRGSVPEVSLQRVPPGVGRVTPRPGSGGV